MALLCFVSFSYRFRNQSYVKSLLREFFPLNLRSWVVESVSFLKLSVLSTAPSMTWMNHRSIVMACWLQCFFTTCARPFCYVYNLEASLNEITLEQMRVSRYGVKYNSTAYQNFSDQYSSFSALQKCQIVFFLK